MSNDQSLSDRELEILRLVATGASNKEIGQKLSITTNTVKVHIRNIFGKIGVSSRTEAAMYAVKNGLVINPEVDLEVDHLDHSQESPAIESEKPQQFEKWFDQRRASSRLYQNLIYLVLGLLLVVVVVIIYRQNVSTAKNDNSTAIDTFPRWTTIIPMSIARTASAVAYLDNQLFVFGGDTPNGITEKSEKLNIENGIWTPLEDKPTAVKEIQAVSVNGLVYVPGGKLRNEGVSKIVEVFDPNTNLWSSVESMPAPRSGYSLAAYDGKIYLIGGWDGEAYTNTLFRFDPGSGVWDELSPMAQERAGGGAAIVEGQIYILGGRNDTGVLDKIEIYTLPTSTIPDGEWRSAGKLPEPRYDMAVFSLADYIFIIGGTDGKRQPLPNLVYNPQINSWQEFSSPVNGNWITPGITGSGSELFVLGGTIDEEITKDVYSFKAIFTALLPIVR